MRAEALDRLGLRVDGDHPPPAPQQLDGVAPRPGAEIDGDAGLPPLLREPVERIEERDTWRLSGRGVEPAPNLAHRRPRSHAS